MRRSNRWGWRSELSQRSLRICMALARLSLSSSLTGGMLCGLNSAGCSCGCCGCGSCGCGCWLLLAPDVEAPEFWRDTPGLSDSTNIWNTFSILAVSLIVIKIQKQKQKTKKKQDTNFYSMLTLPSYIFILTQIFNNLLCLGVIHVNDLKLGQICWSSPIHDNSSQDNCCLV